MNPIYTYKGIQYLKELKQEAQDVFLGLHKMTDIDMEAGTFRWIADQGLKPMDDAMNRNIATAEEMASKFYFMDGIPVSIGMPSLILKRLHGNTNINHKPTPILVQTAQKLSRTWLRHIYPLPLPFYRSLHQLYSENEQE